MGVAAYTSLEGGAQWDGSVRPLAVKLTFTCFACDVISHWYGLLVYSLATTRPPMSDVPPTRPFLVCPCGYETDFLAVLRRHQYTVHDGLIGHHTQLPRRRGREASTNDGDPLTDVGDRCRLPRAASRPPVATAATDRGGRASNGNLADDESETFSRPLDSHGPEVPPTPPAPSESESTAHSAVESQLRTLLELTRILAHPADGGGSAADAVPEYLYSSVGLHVRALYEALGDARRAEPLVTRRKRAKTGRFSSVRLRALQRFVLQVGGAGLSEKDQEFLYEFLDVWDGTKAGMAEDAGHHKTLRYTFPSVTAFKDALRDDLHDAALSAGWKKVRLVEGGVACEAYFRDVPQVIRALLKKGNIQWWSGVAGPAPPTDKRESPLDGDAFRLCEELVMKNRDELACVLGLHVFSDSSQLSWSGGTFSVTLEGCVTRDAH